MKNVFLFVAMIIGISFGLKAQTSCTEMKHETSKTDYKNGVIMVDNKVMLCVDHACTPLKSTYTCKDGCKVAIDGTVTKPDGSSTKLMNGYKIGEDGVVMMIPHGQTGHVCTATCTEK